MEWVIVGIAVLIAIGLFVVIPILTTWYSFSTVRLLWKNAKAERKLAERELAERRKEAGTRPSHGEQRSRIGMPSCRGVRAQRGMDWPRGGPARRSHTTT
jgi:hypothetical protein